MVPGGYADMEMRLVNGAFGGLSNQDLAAAVYAERLQTIALLARYPDSVQTALKGFVNQSIVNAAIAVLTFGIAEKLGQTKPGSAGSNGAAGQAVGEVPNITKLTAVDFRQVSMTISQKQMRHIEGRPEYRGIDSFGLSNEQLEDFGYRCVVALLKRGAVPVKSSSELPGWVPEMKYHGSHEEMAMRIISDWKAGKLVPDHDGLWFALLP